MNYRLGLDIGITSIGFAVTETDENGEPKKIQNLGVRIFDTPEVGKEGAPPAKPRRDARGLRRRIRRKVHRRERTEVLLKKYFGEKVVSEVQDAEKDDVFYLRAKGLDEKLSGGELGKVLLYFVKHRGFLSNRKSDKDDEEGGKLLSATAENSKYLKEKGYRSVGEMLYKDDKYYSFVDKKKKKDSPATPGGENGKEKVYHVRNKEDSYDNTFLRDDLKAEILLILEKQKAEGIIDDEFIEKYVDIFYKNRNFDEGPGSPSKYGGEFKVGKCPFIKDETRAPKSSYTAEYAHALEKLNSLKVIVDGESRWLTESERETLMAQIKERGEIKFSSVKKTLKLPEDAMFNLLNYSPKKTIEENEKSAKFVSLANSYKIRKALSPENATDIDLIDRVAEILALYKSDEKRTDAFSKIVGLSEEEKDKLLAINVSGFGGTSIKFLRNILPYLEQGQKYSDACASAGYNHTDLSNGIRSKFLDTKEVFDSVSGIRVPVVHRAVSQTVKVINAIIRKYGSPLAINVELAREMSKTHEERQKMTRENNLRAQENENIVKILKTEFGLEKPNGQDILKYRLYEEQGGKCAYSQTPLSRSELFSPDYAQIDHVIPYSKCFDDSLSNKVLVLAKENQNKRNRLPYEYLGSDETRWENFKAFVTATYKGNRAKTERLLKKKFTADDEKEWKSRNLNDTKYISRFVLDLLKDNLLFAESERKKKVTAVNGRITSYVRKMWGINKVREEGDKHHAIDAAVIACITDGMINKISRFNMGKEYMFRTSGCYVTSDGEVITEEQYDTEYGKRLKQPYENFVSELELRQSVGYDDVLSNGVRPIFVSRRVSKKKKGQIHDATIRSARNLDKGETVSRVPLSKLKLVKNKDGEYEIKGYYRPQDDRLLYEKLLSLLIANGGNAEKAFKDPVYKPKADGTDGPQVKKVKVVDVMTLGVSLDKVHGVAGNGSMVRIDVFAKAGKFYAVPVYVKDAYDGVLPNRAVVANKPYNEWQEIDDTFTFKFSLYKNDLVYVKHKSGLTLKKTNSDDKCDTTIFKEGFLYYDSCDRASGAATFFTIDNSYAIHGVGIKTLERFEKCEADYFGNIRFVENEKREDL